MRPTVTLPTIYPSKKPTYAISEVALLLEDEGLEGHDLQTLFDSFARQNHGVVSLPEFNTLLEAYGYDNLLDETGFLNILEANSEYTFYSAVDQDGPYYGPEPLEPEAECAESKIRQARTARPTLRG